MELVCAIITLFVMLGVALTIVATSFLVPYTLVKLVMSLFSNNDSIISPYGYVISKAEIKRQMDYGLSYDEAIDWIESELQVNEILGGIMGD
jgi:hypothetical protein